MDSWFASDAPLRKKGQEDCHYSNWSILPVNIPYFKKNQFLSLLIVLHTQKKS